VTELGSNSYVEINNYNNLKQLKWTAAVDIEGELDVTFRFVLRPNYICKTLTLCNLPIYS